MTMHKKPVMGFDLVAMAQGLSRNGRCVHEFEGLVFPMVTLDHRADIDWLVGMGTVELHNQPAWIDLAIQQTRLQMNDVGARAESAFLGVSMVLSARWSWHRPKPDHVIKRPFLIWIERKGLSKPLFVGHITEEDWKNPGNISI